MRIQEAISAVDALYPNQFSEEQKIGWLSECDSAVWENVICTHVRSGDMPESFSGYGAATDRNTLLLAKPPHDAIYRHYLAAQMDLGNGEMDRYNNSAALFNLAFSELANWYNRTHTPLERTRHFAL